MAGQKPPKVALVSDLTGYGRCSLTVLLPILSCLGIQACPLPTAILSNHCGFDRFFFDDYTGNLPAYLQEWEQLSLQFDAIYTGFLGSEAQLTIITDFIHRFAGPDTLIITDPIMGDDGIIPPPYTDALCEKMKDLVSLAHIITPNFTEAAKLVNLPYQPNPDDALLKEVSTRLLDSGPEAVVITGIERNHMLGNYVAEKGKEAKWIWQPLCGPRRVGTGDLLTAVMMGSLLQPSSLSLPQAVKKATNFIEHALLFSENEKIPIEEGVCFEPLLGILIKGDR